MENFIISPGKPSSCQCRSSNMDSTDGGCRGLPKLQELFRRQRRDSETLNESPDLEFSYGDADFYDNEIAELYCYTEEPEFHQNLKSFEEIFASEGYKQWTTATDTQQRKFVVFLQNELEVADMERRMSAIQSVLYLVQGVFGECETEENQQYWSKKNVYLLYDLGLFTSFVQLLHLEMENKTAVSAALKKQTLSIADSKELRLILNVLYTMVETMRHLDDDDGEEKSLKKQFRNELSMTSYKSHYFLFF
ncbi:Striatin-interacting protein 1,Striatin-interacting protein 2,Striatin-interacting proteins 2,Striatin-interacting protein 1 homolog [Acanthosepion pharaonis]|uniref:Striatin-interacting protein 1,Striatin-interacting protein 2,Striatin-interacting proteins 2,Striatin-interacting protein 1 homolog n=1 Tax=Acanthosepion pharaonis TaxID=158019 RepID=A0A812E8D1_ACAPH|nr:Striatin-interacting protein 1,Striatin-interacting protein 2,Striatin-interacting proteins 2,Striatin-interacting protein 1 homolog [Sepia pharaonis]